MKQLFLSTIVLGSVLIFFSCSKEGDAPPTPRQVDSVKIFGVDSSELVKSITTINMDSTGGGADSSIAYLYYDTVNRKIFLSSAPISSPNSSNYLSVLSYNTSYQISNIQSNPAVPPDTSANTIQAGTVDYIYDNDHIISSEISTYPDGSKEVENIYKAVSPSGGYSLSTKDALDYIGDSSLNTFNFDPNGRLTSWSVTSLPATGPWLSDSLVYDVSGNINTVIENDSTYVTDVNLTLHYLSPVNAFQMNSRATNGNELSTLNKILSNGISQLPDVTIGNSAVGGILTGFDDDFFYQFTEHPASSITVYQGLTNSYLTFSPNAQFDSKNRLISLKMYNGDTANNYYETVKLGYYK
ncbi:MAG TPA: hypothetical protein VIJ75_01625 [Hanamia sp.]